MTRLVKRLPPKCEFLFVSDNDMSRVYRGRSGRIYIRYPDGEIFSLSKVDLRDISKRIIQYAAELEIAKELVHSSEEKAS